jgi:hypothetical protein
VRAAEDDVLGRRVVVPLLQQRDVGRAELPLPDRVDLADRESGALLPLRHREPELGQLDALVHEHLLENGHMPEEPVGLIAGAEAHDRLDPGAVVPGAVEQHDLSRGGQVRHVPLEVPLMALALGRRLQRHDPGAARVQVLGESLDGAALARGVAALEQDDYPLAGVLDPVLELEELYLQQPLVVVVLGPVQPLAVRVVLLPGIDDRAVGLTQDRVVLVGVVYPHARRHYALGAH